MIKCLIVEDEPLAYLNLKRALDAIGGVHILRHCTDADSAFAYAAQHHVDLLFLDVHLGQENGLRQLKKAQPMPPVIVVSANSQYAWQGFELDVCDYLLKPFTEQRLRKALDKYKSSIDQSTLVSAHFMVKTDTRLEAVYYRDLICIEGMGDYRRIVTHQRKIMTLQTFKEMEEQLDAEQVVRIHKSFMVQLNAIVEYHNTRVTLSNGQQLPVSDTYRKSLKERLQSK